MNPNAIARQILILGLAAGFALPAAAFTAEQAAAGRATFEQNCVACHGSTLRQLPSAILAGPEFVSKWGERTTAELIALAGATMPPDRPGALSAAEYLGVMAYILQSNGGTASAQALTAATGVRIGTGLESAGCPRACVPRRAPHASRSRPVS